MIHVEAFDWNCPQHITPRYTADEIQDVVRALEERLHAVEQATLPCATARVCHRSVHNVEAGGRSIRSRNGEKSGNGRKKSENGSHFAADDGFVAKRDAPRVKEEHRILTPRLTKEMVARGKKMLAREGEILAPTEMRIAPSKPFAATSEKDDAPA